MTCSSPQIQNLPMVLPQNHRVHSGHIPYSCKFICCFDKCHDQTELGKERVYFRLQVIAHH